MTHSASPSQINIQGDNPLLGMALMLAFCAFIPFADALMKMLSATVAVVTLMLVRYGVQILVMAPVMLKQRGGFSHLWHIPRRVWWLLFWRSAMHIGGITGMYFGLKHMPLADTTAIAFLYPILMLFAGHLFLGEQVGIHRTGAAFLGFIGTLMVVQPNFVEVGANALWPLGVACSFVVYMLVTRQMSGFIDPVSIQVVSGSMCLVMLIVVAFLLPQLGGGLSALGNLTSIEWLMLLGAGVLGTCGHWLMTAAVHFAPASTLAPMQYLEIPFATLIGWLVFSDLPNDLAALGIAVTMASGLYIIYREQLAQRRAKKAKA